MHWPEVLRVQDYKYITIRLLSGMTQLQELVFQKVKTTYFFLLCSFTHDTKHVECCFEGLSD